MLLLSYRLIDDCVASRDQMRIGLKLNLFSSFIIMFTLIGMIKVLIKGNSLNSIKIKRNDNG